MLHLIQSPDQLATLSGLQGFPPLSRQVLEQQQPDAHWVLHDEQAIAAYCSLWWRSVPTYPGKHLGVIGHYAAQDLPSAHLLLDHACQQLADQGCTMAIAPMDGNTWRRYRLITDRGTEPTFFLEPDHPDDWVEPLQAQGFMPLAHYTSALNPDLTQQDPRMERVAQRMAAAGVTVRSLNLQQFDAELLRIHQLSLTSFRHNFLYTPITQAEFMAQYRQVKPYIQPELVLLAEQQHQLVGFLFAVPDLLQAQRHQPINTVIIKTVAILPGRTYAGLGNLLVEQVQAIAHQLGYTRAIHALMHDANQSRNLSERYAQTIRRYTLFAKSLEDAVELQ